MCYLFPTRQWQTRRKPGTQSHRPTGALETGPTVAGPPNDALGRSHGFSVGGFPLFVFSGFSAGPINRLTRVAGVRPLRSEQLLEKSRMKNIVKTAAALALLAGASQAFAAEVTDTIQVTATINSACTIDSAADLVFP